MISPSKAIEISGFCNCDSPPGFQEAAVASSAIAINAFPYPIARAPDPIGLSDVPVSTRWQTTVGEHRARNNIERMAAVIRIVFIETEINSTFYSKFRKNKFSKDRAIFP